MSVALQFKLTQTGQVAVWNANNTGTSLNLTHIQFGSGNRVVSGTETALLSPQQAVAIAAGFSVSSSQIRMSAIFSGNQNYVIREVGLWAGDPAVAGSKLVGYWSQASGDLAMKSPGVDFIFSHDMVLDAAVPAGSLTILADNAQSAMLAMITAHEAKADPHPQYTTGAEVNALIEARVGDYVTSTNVGNAYTVALDPVVTAYTAKTAFAFKASAANTGATTLNAGGGAKALVREDGTAMQAGDIPSGAVVTVVFDIATDAFRSTEIVASQIAAAIQAQTYTAFATSGVAPTFTLTPSPAITAYAAGQRFRVKFGAAGNGADTLNVSGLGAKSLKQYSPAGSKTAAVIAANQLVDVEYDGVDFVLLDPLGGGLQYVATPNIAATATLTASHVGRLLNLQGTPGTVTLPAANSLPAGATYHLWSQDNTWTVAKQAADFINTGNGSLSTLSLAKGETVILVSDGGNTWITAGGSALNQFSNAFASSKAASGYQKLPGGLILQWKTFNPPNGSSYTVSFPIAFPTAFLAGWVCEAAASANAQIGVGTSGGTVTGINVFAWYTGGSNVSWTGVWTPTIFAIGY